MNANLSVLCERQKLKRFYYGNQKRKMDNLLFETIIFLNST